MIYTTEYKYKNYHYIIGEYENKICLFDAFNGKKRVKNESHIQKKLGCSQIPKETPLLKEAKIQLKEYLDGKRKEFNLPLLLLGSDFQNKVWNQLLQIPYGQTISYKQLATNCGNEKAYRAVANANGANKIALLIPCHRVIASDGGLGGYSGGLELKKSLLQLEGIAFD
ncbi:MAG TPA: methylated-DNA--[protein]-cysteine S-methyltransferase [Arcobacter sp.]|nr:methylated-DNA--[protein]-cysteine S-methyltransferase [Arcobacter sp.]